MKKHSKIFGFSLVLTLIVSILCASFTIFSSAEGRSVADLVQKELKLWYDEPAPDDDNRETTYNNTKYSGWEVWALPIGNGFAGSKVFGLTERERIQINENTLSTNGNTKNSGTTNFTETYVHFNHTYENVTNYSRDLILGDATSHVKYDYEGVTYTREYFASYPDGVIVLKFDATGEKNLDFTLEPKIPYYNYEHRYGYTYDGEEHDPADVTAELLSDGTALITLEGYLPGFNDNGNGTQSTGYGMYFEGQFKVFTDGKLSVAHSGGEVDEVDEYSNGTVTVTDANSAYVIIALGTNYELDPQVFKSANLDKLNGFAHPHEKVSAVIEAASEKSYGELRADHVEDYTNLFNRVKLDLGTEVPSVTTDELIANYKAGDADLYVDEMLFAYGRYLHIASSREGGLPSNLNGIWNRYHCAVCMNGYWHNINTQMNYWASFNTNLAECFTAYLGYYQAYSEANNNSALSELKRAGLISSNSDVVGNVWSIATGVTPFSSGASSGGRDGWGNTPLMAEVFWAYYEYTGDVEILRETVFPAMLASANFLTYVMQESEDGLYLAPNSGSPEQSTTSPYLDYAEAHPGFVPVGTAYDQALTYSNYLHVLDALEILGLSDEELDAETLHIVNRIREQVDKLDPIIVGYSGQVKEFREEFYYGEIGEKAHRHISHLCSFVQGSSITNVKTPAWVDAAEVTMENRGHTPQAWADIMRISAWARIGNGDEAYDDLCHMINGNIGSNLLSLLGGIFQVEANLAAPSALSELLLQSHEGYIAPLPALPSVWSDGAYSGLVAIGGFEVGAAWTDGFADEITILSKNGGEVSVKYINLSKATVKDSKGNAVEFTANGLDLITFKTEKGESYVISAIPEDAPTEKPTDLTVKYTSSAAILNWGESENGESYNVYRATNSEPTYTLIAKGVEATTYTIPHTDFSSDNQYTYAVSAVSEDGRESARAHLTMIPIITPDEAYAYLVDGEMTIYFSEVVGDGVKYLVYEKSADGTEKLIKETELNCLVIKKTEGSSYFIKTVINGIESSSRTEVSEIELAEKTAVKNLFLEKPISIVQGYKYKIDGVEYTSGNHVQGNASYPLTNVLDGSTATESRWAIKDSLDTCTTPLTVMIDIGSKSELDTLTIVTYYIYGPALKIDVSCDGEAWTEAAYAYNEAWKKLATTITLDLDGAVGRYVRVTFNAKAQDSGYVNASSIKEISCSGALLREEVISKYELQSEINACLTADLSKYSDPDKEIFNEKIKAAIEVFENEFSESGEISAAVADLKSAQSKIKEADPLMPESADRNYGNLTFELEELDETKYMSGTGTTAYVPGWWNSNLLKYSVMTLVKGSEQNKYLSFYHSSDAVAMTSTPYWDFMTSEWQLYSTSRENITFSDDTYDYAVFDMDFTTNYYSYTLNGKTEIGTTVPTGATDVKLAYPTGANLYPYIRSHNSEGATASKYIIMNPIYENGAWYLASGSAKTALKTKAGEWNHITAVYQINHANLSQSKLLVYVNGKLHSTATVGGTPVESYFASFRVDFVHGKCGSIPFEIAFDNLTTNYYGNGDGSYAGDIAELVSGTKSLLSCTDAVYNSSYVHPDGTLNTPSPESAYAYADGTELTVYYSSVEGNGVKYLIYEKTKNGTVRLIKETALLCAVIENYSKDSTYFVKASINGSTSAEETYVSIETLAEKIDSTNLFLGKDISIIQGYKYKIDGVEYTSGAHVPGHVAYPITNVLDGNLGNESRWSILDSVDTYKTPLTVMIDLGGKCELSLLKIHTYYIYGPALKIDVSCDGKAWTEAAYQYNEKWQKLKTAITLNLNYAEARYVRITFNAKAEESYYNGSVCVNASSIIEITCTGSILVEKPISRVELEKELKDALAPNTDKYPEYTMTRFNEKINSARAAFENSSATNAALEDALADVLAAVKALKNSDQLLPEAADRNYGNLNFEFDEAGSTVYGANSRYTVAGWLNNKLAAQSIAATVKEFEGNKYLSLNHAAGKELTMTPYWDYLTSDWEIYSTARDSITFTADSYDYAVFDMDFTSYKYLYTLDGEQLSGETVPEGAENVRLAYPEGAWMYPYIRCYDANGTKTDRYIIMSFLYEGGAWYLKTDSTKTPLKSEAGEWNHVSAVMQVDHTNLGNSKLLVYVNGKLHSSKALGGNFKEIYFASFRTDFVQAGCSGKEFDIAYDNLATNYYGCGDGSYFGDLKELVGAKRTQKWCDDLIYNRDYVNPDGSYNKGIVNRGYTLLLEGETFINKYISFELPTSITKEYIKEHGGVLIFTERNKPTSLENAVYGSENYIAPIEYSGIFGGYEEFRARTEGIAAKELGDVFYFRPYVVIDGEYLYGELSSYSVLEYSTNRLANSTDESLKSTIVAMLNYGAASQTYFGYKTDSLVNNCLQESDKILNWNDEYLDTAPTPDTEMTKDIVSTGTLTSNGNTLLLEGAVSIKYYIGVGDDASKFKTAESAVFYFWTEEDYNSLMARGEALSRENASYTRSAELVYSGSAYGYEYTAVSEQFVAKEFGRTLYRALYVVDSEGTLHCSGVSSYSPETYASQKINDGQTAKIDELVMWLTVYGERAKAYFGN